MQARSQSSQTDIDFTATERKTKRLMELKGASYSLGDRFLFENVNLILTAATRVGLVGANGSGKTTLLRLLRGEIEPGKGTIERADGLRIVYFDQNRPLDVDLTLRRALAPHSDSVIYQERTIHVASWAARFLFSNEQLNQPVSRLSGGERARVLIAKLMLEPADVLLLDEPTNDLDIPTLEVLEESLLEFRGAVVLVTHDRYMLDRVSSVVWGLNGDGRAEVFADYSQWEAALAKAQAQAKLTQPGPKQDASQPVGAGKKKLSYLDSRDFETIEDRIADAEAALNTKQVLLEDPAVTSDPQRLTNVLEEIESAKATVEELYERWAELEAKIS
jgi:ATP-binding cassette subfamily F protein uup